MILPVPPKEIFEEFPVNMPGLMRGFQHKRTKMVVLRSYSKSSDGSDWIHVSVSYKNKTPSWEEMAAVKNLFLGPEVEAYQVMPKREDYVNVHRYCLHIWMPVDQNRRVCNLKDLIDEKAI